LKENWSKTLWPFWIFCYFSEFFKNRGKKKKSNLGDQKIERHHS